MKHPLRLFSVLILLVMAGSVSSAFAQSTRFAFVNKERTLIFIHEGDQKDTLFLPVPAQKFRAERIAVLGSTSDGKSLLVAGQIYYAAIGSGAQAMVQGFFRIPIPEHGKQLDYTTLLTQGKILRQVYEDATKILPLGVITPDGQRWFGTWMSSAPNNPAFTVYHGRFDQNGDLTTTDSAVVTGAAAFDAGYHMSNLTTTEDGVKLLFVVVDKLTSGGLNRARIGRWVPGEEVAFTGDGSLTAQMNSVIGGSAPVTDKAFGFAVRGVGSTDAAKLQFAVVTQSNNDEIKIYEIQNVANPVLNANFVKGTITRSALPGNLDFFTGYTGNNGDVYSEAPQQGNGGDMMFSRDGSKLIFVTREFPEDVTIRPQSSAIFEYGLNSGEINLLYNDEAREERQPIFVDGTGIIPEPEQVITVTPNTINFGTVLVPATKTNTFTITNTGTVDANITGVSLGSAPEFTITANSVGATAPYAFSLAPNATATFDVTFTPTVKGTTTSSFVVTWDTDKSLTQTITGTGDLDAGSVARDYQEVFTFSVAPNPVQGAAVISLNGVETSNVSLELVDATGRAVWSASSKLNVGATSTFDLNAQNLAAGSYFLVVRAADVQAVGQVMITK